MTIVDIACQADKALLLTNGSGIDAEPVKARCFAAGTKNTTGGIHDVGYGPGCLLLGNHGWFSTSVCNADNTDCATARSSKGLDVSPII